MRSKLILCTYRVAKEHDQVVSRQVYRHYRPCVINCTYIFKVGIKWHPPSGSSDDRSTNMSADPSIIFRAEGYGQNLNLVYSETGNLYEHKFVGGECQCK